MKEKTTLLAGPWIGEFGWELFCWQAFVRKQSRKFDKTIVISRPGNKFIYEDFVDEYVEFDPKGTKTDSWLCPDSKPYKDLVMSIPHTHYLDGQFNIGIHYTQQGVRDLSGMFFGEQEFFKYQKETDIESYDIILHGRDKEIGPERNWPKEKWDELANILKEKYSVACIGKNEAFKIENTIDLRGISLEELTSLMSKSKIVVGPSSGPMHFASLCGVKHLVWSTEYNRVRYVKDWNPFNTEVVFHTKGGWNPDVQDIVNLIDKNI